MTNEPTLQEKTTAMKEAIRMAKEVHEAPERSINSAVGIIQDSAIEPTPKSTQILTTAKQIYDWLTA